MLRRLIFTAACLGCWWPTAAADSSATTAACPPGFARLTTTHGATCCPAGYLCFERAEGEDIALRLADYARDTRRWFPSCTVGPSLAGALDIDLRWRAIPAPIGVTCGLTLRLGRLRSRR